MLWLTRIRESVRSGLWAIPTVCVLTSVALVVAMLWIDQTIAADRTAWYLFGGGPDGARALLSTISAAMLTFMALVFSITIVALQLASGQFSPRVQRAFLRDTTSKLTLGVFIGTFTYSVLILRTVRSDGEGQDPFVPELATMMSVVLVLTSVAFFVRYIDHIARSIRAIALIKRVAAETVAVIEDLYPERMGQEIDEDLADWPSDPSAVAVPSTTAGPVGGVDSGGLMELASEADLRVELVVRVGDFVPSNGTIARVAGVLPENAERRVQRAVSVASERSMRQDVAYGIRQLVDVADRALSPGVNDPTTAVQVLDALHDLLRRLVGRRFPSPLRADAQGTIRIYAPAPTWEELLGLALDEIRISGAGSLQVARRMTALLDDLATVAPEARRSSIRTQRRRLADAVARGFSEAHDRDQAARPSLQGQL